MFIWTKTEFVAGETMIDKWYNPRFAAEWNVVGQGPTEHFINYINVKLEQVLDKTTDSFGRKRETYGNALNAR